MTFFAPPKRPFPKSFADQDDARPVRHIFCLGKIPAEDRRHLHDGEKIRRNRSAVDPLRRRVLHLAREVQRFLPNERQIRQRLLRSPPVEVVRITDRSGIKEAQDFLAQENKLFGLRIRQRSKEHRIDHAEDGGVGPNPERQCSDLR
jgi:hypothetical protein